MAHLRSVGPHQGPSLRASSLQDISHTDAESRVPIPLFQRLAHRRSEDSSPTTSINRFDVWRLTTHIATMPDPFFATLRFDEIFFFFFSVFNQLVLSININKLVSNSKLTFLKNLTHLISIKNKKLETWPYFLIKKNFK